MKLETNYRKKFGKYKYVFINLKTIHSYITNCKARKKIKREVSKYFELNGNEDITYQNLWDAAKECLEGTVLP